MKSFRISDGTEYNIYPSKNPPFSKGDLVMITNFHNVPSEISIKNNSFEVDEVIDMGDKFGYVIYLKDINFAFPAENLKKI